MSYCPNCSAVVDAQASGCSACGAVYTAGAWSPLSELPVRRPMKSSTKAIATLAVMVPLVGIAGLASFQSICACGDAEMFWGGKLGVSPVRGDPQEVRAAILKKLPPGSSVEEAHEFISRATQGPGWSQRCNTTPREIACHFPVLEAWWGFRKTGFFVRFVMDEKGRLADASARGYELWFEEPR